jgi:acyl-CoA synthetase (AMP-forming)/AMP-acid ligase II
LPSLERVISAGAPVPPRVLAQMKACIAADGEVHTPYGATEALPVASIAASEVLGETRHRWAQGGGTCVGRKFPGIEWKVIAIADGPIATLADADELPAGQIGELVVRGPVVTRQYVTRVETNAMAKITDGSRFWHRMGDVGYLDETGRFWYCGRKAHRVRTANGTMFTIPCEAIFNQHPDVYRSALVGVGPPQSQRPVVIVEPWPGKMPKGTRARRSLFADLAKLARANPVTESIHDFLMHRAMPVDIRHNAKIFREKLAAWAARKLG